MVKIRGKISLLYGADVRCKPEQQTTTCDTNAALSAFAFAISSSKAAFLSPLANP